MKTLLLSFLTIGLLASGLAAPAADPAPVSAPAAVGGHGDLASKLGGITSQLELTEAQRATITPILQREAAELRALRDEAKAGRLEKACRFRAINQKASGEIRAVLTAEQARKYDELRAAAKAEFKQKMKERRAAGG